MKLIVVVDASKAFLILPHEKSREPSTVHFILEKFFKKSGLIESGEVRGPESFPVLSVFLHTT